MITITLTIILASTGLVALILMTLLLAFPKLRNGLVAKYRIKNHKELVSLINDGLKYRATKKRNPISFSDDIWFNDGEGNCSVSEYNSSNDTYSEPRAVRCPNGMFQGDFVYDKKRKV